MTELPPVSVEVRESAEWQAREECSDVEEEARETLRRQMQQDVMAADVKLLKDDVKRLTEDVKLALARSRAAKRTVKVELASTGKTVKVVLAVIALYVFAATPAARDIAQALIALMSKAVIK